MIKILMLGCGGAAAGNFIKCLRKSERDYWVVGTDLNEFQLQASDVDVRYLEDPKNKFFADWINDLVEEEDIELVCAAPDIWVKRLGQRRNKINAKTFLPQDITLGICSDKYTTYRHLKDNGVPVPETRPIEALGFIQKATEDICSLSDFVWVRARHGAGSKAALPCSSHHQVRQWIEYWVLEKGMFPANFIVSEFLPGREFASQLIYKDGNLLTYFIRERLEYVFGHIMPSGQSSSPSVQKTWPADAKTIEVDKVALAAIKAVDPKPHGVYGVDMKEDRHGNVKVTEINAGRFYTTSDFPAALGFNMPELFVRSACADNDIDFTTPTYDNQEHYWVRSMDREGFLWTK